MYKGYSVPKFLKPERRRGERLAVSVYPYQADVFCR